MERLVWMILVALHPLPMISANMEGDALHSLRSNLQDPYSVLQSWDPTLVNPCTWFHVTCNNENSVIRVDLGNAALSGQLVLELGQLKNLQYLELYSNNISGQIPGAIGNLTNLVSLDLYLNSFDGPIPDSLGKMMKLRFLWLNNNNLTGSIPMSLTNITALQVLDLSNNRLSGPVLDNGSFSLFTLISFANNLNLCGLVSGSLVRDLHHFHLHLHLFHQQRFLLQGKILLLQQLLEEWLLVLLYCLLPRPSGLHLGGEESLKSFSLMYLLKKIQKSIWDSSKGFRCENCKLQRIVLATRTSWGEVGSVRCTRDA
ncbi:hypothetical protein Dsin_016590 [Dipteronia sinensis]|uniref:Leucine-rich repeat-containing N-terminal plant-type domain-containing protein n=1 Tax=Dipteronia sinensis TaxID=43782 RepID=A0AAE0ADI6_9ROSI|nr:hypothetical protein Dsin_016590 [Dipteronia sinensis]